MSYAALFFSLATASGGATNDSAARRRRLHDRCCSGHLATSCSQLHCLRGKWRSPSRMKRLQKGSTVGTGQRSISTKCVTALKKESANVLE